MTKPSIEATTYDITAIYDGYENEVENLKLIKTSGYCCRLDTGKTSESRQRRPHRSGIQPL
jgi:hypothetical protein